MAFKNDVNTNIREGKMFVIALAILQAQPELVINKQIRKGLNADQIFKLIDGISNLYGSSKEEIDNFINKNY